MLWGAGHLGAVLGACERAVMAAVEDGSCARYSREVVWRLVIRCGPRLEEESEEEDSVPWLHLQLAVESMWLQDLSLVGFRL